MKSSGRALARIGTVAIGTGATAMLILSDTAGAATTTRVAEGALEGRREGAVAAYLGVPFAAPPVGNARWKPPSPAAHWAGTRRADKFSASCQQTLMPTGFGPWTVEYVASGAVSEDCLYLNVWTPASAPSEKRPVLFWIHGGGFTQGSTSVAVYNGAPLASKGIVVVSANYRVGVYGFLAHPELSAESPQHASGNYGLLDMVAALRWVQDNIAAFGGDPSRVTIAGQSAGASAVHHLIASPLAKGLFSQAIAQSGSGMGIPVPDRGAAEAQGKALNDAGDPLNLAGLRKLTPAQLTARVGAVRFGASVDGWFLPDASFVDKNTHDTPILTGMTANEMTGLSPYYGKMTPTILGSEIASSYGPLASDFAKLYPARDDAQAWMALNALSRDRGLASMYLWAQERLRATRYPIYAYLWTHTEPGPEAARYLAFHSSELPYVFDTLDTAKRPFTAEDRALAKQMSSRWVAFVTSGNPNAEGWPAWPPLTVKDKLILEIGENTRTRPVLADETLSVFDRHVKAGGTLGLF